jgi:hypothetical protein
METRAFIAVLRNKLADLERKVDWMEKSGEIHPIDYDLILSKTRELYDHVISSAQDNGHKSILTGKRVVEPEEKPLEKVKNEVRIEEEPKPEPEPVPEPEPEPEPEPVKTEIPQPPLFFQQPSVENRPPVSEPKVAPAPPPPRPKPAPAPPPKTPEPEKPVTTILFQREDSLNEALGKQKSVQDVASALTEIPVADIWSAIAINDRFLFTRELFGNDSESFKNTVSLLNSISTWEAAKSYIADHFSWDKNNPVAKDFLAIVRRRFL